MKKVLVCALAVLFLMASCTTVFAATQTTTTYAEGDTLDANNMVVTTVVTEVANGTMISFLAKNGEDYVYADQQTSNGGETVFTYAGPKESISSVEVLSGSNAQDAVLYEQLLSEEGYVRVINVEVNDHEDANTVLYLPEYKAGTNYTFELEVDADLEFGSATLNDTDTAIAMTQHGNVFTFTDSEEFTNGATFNMNLHTVVDVSISAVTTGSFVASDAEKLTVFAKVTAPENCEYGVILSNTTNSESDLTYSSTTPGVKTYAALGKGADGSFAIQLVNQTDVLELTEGDWVARVYVEGSNGEYFYSDVVDVEKY